VRYQINERVVTIGGGTGSFTMLSELKKYVTRLWSIVTMMDSGGSSRRLIDEFGRPLPLGDLRQALVALSRSSRLWGDLFSYRFPDTPDVPDGVVGGHSLGNLILHALQDQNDGDLLGALEDAEEILNSAGHVIPVTLAQSTLCARLSDGSVVRGEANIDRPEDRPLLPIADMFLDPPVPATPRARKALERADRVLIGPGDLFTSIIPCLLVDGISDAIRSCDGEVIYICNVMTKQGETDGFSASDFIRQVHHYLGRRVDAVVVNSFSPAQYPPDLLKRYKEQGSEPVIADLEAIRNLVPRVMFGPVASTEVLIRHDAERVLLQIWPELAG
jgi:uncharacterized cofD-like protein